MSRSGRILPTPFGSLAVVVDDAVCGGAGAVVASGFRPLPAAESDLTVRAQLLDLVELAVGRWAAGDLTALEEVPVAITGTGFRSEAWRALRRVPPGSVIGYGELAARAGNPRAARAAGTACATNPFAPFVPCHRVVRSNGALGEYGYGIHRKQAMLRHEGAR